MADFIIQTQSGVLEDEERFIEERLKQSRYTHTYTKMTLKELESIKELNKIPVGTIDFVSLYLRNNYGVAQENPIEIPKYLRTDEFLKRDYQIVTYDKLPRHGRYFIKDVSQLKFFGETVDTDFFITDELFDYVKKNELDPTLIFDKTHLYQVSSIYRIQSEYRVYVIGGEIECIANYNGDCTIFPDINLIKKAINLIALNEKWLRSYTIDVMVGKEGTALIEVHNFASVGLYSTLWGNDLPYAYRDGIDYLIHDNKLIEM